MIIGLLTGRVAGRRGGRLLLDVGGVGYLVTTTTALLEDVEDSAEMRLYVHHHIREAAEALFGFVDPEELAVFELLIGVHGVGPSIAMAVLSACSPDEIGRIVQAGDVRTLAKANGVGPKMAERIIAELRKLYPELQVAAPAGRERGPVADSRVGAVSAALKGLGYDASEIRRAVAGVSSDASEAERLRQALLVLAAS